MAVAPTAGPLTSPAVGPPTNPAVGPPTNPTVGPPTNPAVGPPTNPGADMTAGSDARPAGGLAAGRAGDPGTGSAGSPVTGPISRSAGTPEADSAARGTGEPGVDPAASPVGNLGAGSGTDTTAGSDAGPPGGPRAGSDTSSVGEPGTTDRVAAPEDEQPHRGMVDEWVFAAWLDDGSAGLVSGHRLIDGRAWYWFALVQAGYPMLHLTEWDVRLRSDPFIVKAPEMWAGHDCVAPLAQWTIGNEGHAAALDDPDEALGRAYGIPTPMSMDVEWYATGSATPLTVPGGAGFEQVGVAHGVIELIDRPYVEFDDIPGHRWRRWADALGPLQPPEVVAHTGLRAGFAFPDGSSWDWVLSPDGWRRRRRR